MAMKLKKKLQYWFDNQMAKGPASMILMLAGVTFVVLIMVIFVIWRLEPSEDGIVYTSWDTLSAIINAWMPYSDEGGFGYLIPTAVAALFGLLFTSVLIGIITTAIEEKINSLKKGNSIVSEMNHTVFLGFESGSYELINQLVQATGGEKFCLVVAGGVEKDEAEEEIRSNISIPKNFKLIYRNVDICNASALKCCSIETASTVIVSTYDNSTTFKSILAVVKLLRDYPEAKVNIVSSILGDDFTLPDSLVQKKNIAVVSTNDVIARLIARSCSQPGISQTYLEVFNFNGSEIYTDSFEEYAGMTFGEIYCRFDNAVPIGFIKDNKAIIKPDPDVTLEAGDELIYLCEERHKITLSVRNTENIGIREYSHTAVEPQSIAVWGCNEKINTLIRELPDFIDKIIAVDVEKSKQEEYIEAAKNRENCSLYFVDSKTTGLKKITENVNHVILLCNHDIEREDSDIQNMMLYLKLRDIQISFGNKFNITTELFFEDNKDLITSKMTTDFVVANNMSSLLVAQIAFTPELSRVYDELLSNKGAEIRILRPNEDELGCRTISELRRVTYSYGAVLMGYIVNRNGEMETHLNPVCSEEINLGCEDFLIGLC